MSVNLSMCMNVDVTHQHDQLLHHPAQRAGGVHLVNGRHAAINSPEQFVDDPWTRYDEPSARCRSKQWSTSSSRSDLCVPVCFGNNF